MALTIINRPEKTLNNGYVSRWNASRTPLNYKFSSNLFPNNTVDPKTTADSFVYDSSKRGVVVEAANHGFTGEGQYCNVTTSSLIQAFTTTEEEVLGFTELKK